MQVQCLVKAAGKGVEGINQTALKLAFLCFEGFGVAHEHGNLGCVCSTKGSGQEQACQQEYTEPFFSHIESIVSFTVKNKRQEHRKTEVICPGFYDESILRGLRSGREGIFHIL